VDLVPEVRKEKSQNRQRRTPKGKEIHQEDLLIEEHSKGHLKEEDQDLLLEDLLNVEEVQIEGQSDDHQSEEPHLIDANALLDEAHQEECLQEGKNLHQDVAHVLLLHHVLGLHLDLEHLRKNLNRLMNYVCPIYLELYRKTIYKKFLMHLGK
jgi:hypothetical protein